MLQVFNILDEFSNSTLCGGIEVPDTFFNLSATIIRGIKIVVPILLIIWGMLDFAKSVIAKKEEDIKKYQKAFIHRLISAVVVFLVVAIVQLAVSLLGNVEEESGGSDMETSSDIWQCSKKFVNGVKSKQTDTNINNDEIVEDTDA